MSGRIAAVRIIHNLSETKQNLKERKEFIQVSDTQIKPQQGPNQNKAQIKLKQEPVAAWKVVWQPFAKNNTN